MIQLNLALCCNKTICIRIREQGSDEYTIHILNRSQPP